MITASQTIQSDRISPADFRDFLQSWSDVYVFWTERAMLHARRRDNGAVVHSATPGELIHQVMLDYLAKPVRTRA